MNSSQDTKEKYQQYIDSETWKCDKSPTGAHWYVESVCKFCRKEEKPIKKVRKTKFAESEW